MSENDEFARLKYNLIKTLIANKTSSASANKKSLNESEDHEYIEIVDNKTKSPQTDEISIKKPKVEFSGINYSRYSDAWSIKSPIKVIEIEEPEVSFVQKIRNWCFEKKDFCNCENIFFTTLITSLTAGVMLVGIFLILYSVFQKNANSATNTQSLAESNGGTLFVGQNCSGYINNGNGPFCVFGAYCDATNYVCECNTITYYDTYLGYCASKKSLGFFCIDSIECDYTLHLICGSDGFCECISGFTWSSLLGSAQCIRIREVGETCSANSECVDGSYCTKATSGTYRCLCPSGQFASHATRRCETLLKVNERCGYPQQCQQYSTCKQAKIGDGSVYCLCIQNYYYDAITASCVPQKTYNQSCSSNNECLTSVNYQCVSSVCQCNTDSYWNGTYCVGVLGYGQPCNYTNQCNSSMICSLITQSPITQYGCICASGYFFDDYSQKCLQTLSLNQICYSSIQCDESAYCAPNTFLNSYSTSSDSKCACYPGYGPNSNGICVPLSTINETCTTSLDCVSFYLLSCISSTCQCDQYSFWNGAMCQLRHTYNEACNLTITCRSFQNLNCISNTCQCNIGHTFSATYDYCV